MEELNLSNIVDNERKDILKIIRYVFEERIDNLNEPIKESTISTVGELITIINNNTLDTIRKKIEYYKKIIPPDKYDYGDLEKLRIDKINSLIDSYERDKSRLIETERSSETYKDWYEKETKELKEREEKYSNYIKERDEERKKIFAEKELLRLNSKKFLMYGIISAIVTLLIILLFSYKIYQKSRKYFMDLFDFDKDIKEKFISFVKLIGWCSLILLPLAITLYFIKLSRKYLMLMKSKTDIKIDTEESKELLEEIEFYKKLSDNSKKLFEITVGMLRRQKEWLEDLKKRPLNLKNNRGGYNYGK